MFLKYIKLDIYVISPKSMIVGLALTLNKFNDKFYKIYIILWENHTRTS